MLIRNVLLAGALVSGVAAFLPAEIPAGERIPITNPERLRSMGFPPDAENVFVWSRADLGRGRTAPPQRPTPESRRAGDPPPATRRSPESGFRRSRANTPSSITWREYTHCVFGLAGYVGDVPTLAHVQFEVPDGAKLGFLRYWAYDSSTDVDLIFRVYETQQGSASGSQPATTLIAEAFTIGSGGDFNLFAALNDFPVDNENCFYFIQVEFAPPTSTARTTRCAFGSSPCPGRARSALLPQTRPSATFRPTIPSSSSSRRSPSPGSPAAAAAATSARTPR